MKKYTEEILCDRLKEAIPYGAGCTDNVEMISERLARYVYHRAMVYRIECNVSQTKGDENIKEFQGQCGFLRSDQLTPSPGCGGSRYKVIPVTAKQNMKSDLGRKLLVTKVFSPTFDQCKRVSFPEKGLTALMKPMVLKGSSTMDDDVELPFGLDFTFGDAIVDVRNSFTSKTTSFEVARHDFRIEEGQKIGICVWRSKDRIANDVEGSVGELSEAEERKYYGQAKVPVIQTGVVTAVYGDCGEVFAHSINTYEGCSGAIIFLLDKDQPPESVEEHDYGKAIGVYAAGYSPHNLGMSVVAAFHKMTNESLGCTA